MFIVGPTLTGEYDKSMYSLRSFIGLEGSVLIQDVSMLDDSVAGATAAVAAVGVRVGIDCCDWLLLAELGGASESLCCSLADADWGLLWGECHSDESDSSFLARSSFFSNSFCSLKPKYSRPSPSDWR